SYLGGTWDDKANAVAFSSVPPAGGSAGTVFVAGQAVSPTFRPNDTGLNPITPTLLSGGNNYTTAAFVIALNPATADPVYLTYLAGTNGTVANAVAIGAGNQAYVTGYTQADANFPVSGNAFQGQLGGGQDAFLAVLKADG